MEIGHLVNFASSGTLYDGEPCTRYERLDKKTDQAESD